MLHSSMTVNMASLAQRGAKRLRLSSPAQLGWICKDCRRAFACSTQPRQQPQSSSSQSAKQDEKTTHFGFETVAESIKASKGIIYYKVLT